MAGPYARVDTNFFKTTIEIDASDEEVILFRAYLAEINWYNEQLTHPTSDQDIGRLTRDRDALMAKLADALRD